MLDEMPRAFSSGNFMLSIRPTTALRLLSSSKRPKQTIQASWRMVDLEQSLSYIVWMI